nr:LysR family transcriptional regulator [uncultured Cohaesibacter sp.]
MKISAHQIEAFTYTARLKSFSQAANALGVTQSAITQHVANLERTMGSKLFIRRREGLEVTRAAEELFRLSDRLCTLEQAIGEKIEDYRDLKSGYLSIMANAPRPALPIIARFSQLYPDVKTTFSLGSWTLAMERLKNRDVDIAIVTEPTQLPGLYSLELEHQRFCAHMRYDHPLAKRERLSLSDLVHEAVVLPEVGSMTQRVVNEQLLTHKLSLTRVVEMTTYPVVKEAILHGIGVGIMLENCFFPSQQITSRPIEELSQTYPTFLVSPEDKNDLHFVKRFVELAVEEMPKRQIS